MRTLLIALCGLLLSSCVGGASVWVVDQGGGGDFTNIQDAIGFATSGDEIVVRAGTYLEMIDYIGKDLYIHSVAGPEATTIDAEFAGSCVTLALGETSAAILEGFTLAHGGGTMCAAEGGGAGGAIFCDLSSPGLRDCVFITNIAYTGAAIYTRNGTPQISSCVFRGNISDTYGGAITCSTSSPTVRDCLFEDNIAATGDGTIHLTAMAVVEDCIFSGNSARAGAGVNCGHAAADAQIINCLFFDNRATDSHGGAIRAHEASPLIEECLFVRNSSNEDGGALFAIDGAEPRVRNCTFYENSAGRYGGHFAAWASYRPQFDNCIFAQALSGGGIFTSEAYPAFACNDAWENVGGNYVGCPDPTGTDGNISEDPLFCDPGADDFLLRCDSPCAPEHNPDCGLIGREPVGCGASPSVSLTWGGVKALFEK